MEVPIFAASTLRRCWPTTSAPRQVDPVHSQDMAPREAFQKGLAQGGLRSHCTIAYDDTFRFFSLPTTAKGTAKVRPGGGVKINYLYYWSDEFRPSSIENTRVAVRYDPFDISMAYA